ncbi:hypothetical protein AB1Y20_004409 [Prymnesium parvum]|uniref:Inositol 2-dehydrogenase n=1 Tax=Prymnesium parvum TaxID=97485 RepID=A0AB34IW94_PRYPA
MLCAATSLVASGLVLAPTPALLGMAPPRALVQMKLSEGTVNVGIIGAGRIGIVHLEALASCAKANPIIISNPTVAKAQAAAAKFKLPEFTGDAMEVINHPDVEAVWICSPSQFHAEQIKACAAAGVLSFLLLRERCHHPIACPICSRGSSASFSGKHIFCEKPIATGVQETIEAINFCYEKNVKLMTALQRRFDPNFARVKLAITNKEIGEPITIKLCSRDPAPPPFEYVKGGGGLFKDMAVHDLDMARFLMDSEPVSILASGSCQIDKSIESLPGPEAYDTANIIMKFANGKEATIDVCRQAPYGYDQRAEVLGTKAMIVTDNMYPNTARIMSADFTGNADLPYDFFMSRYKEAYIAESIAFVDALVEGKPVPCSGEDGLIALVMAIAAGTSAQERRWVNFSELSEELCGLQNSIPLQQECRVAYEESQDTSGALDLGKFVGRLISFGGK